MKVGGQRHDPAALPPVDDVPIVQQAGCAREQVRKGSENLSPNGIRSRTVQPVASRYTDWVCEISRIYVLWEPRFSVRTDGLTHGEASSQFSRLCEPV
jgi:hypothetical protein